MSSGLLQKDTIICRGEWIGVFTGTPKTSLKGPRERIVLSIHYKRTTTITTTNNYVMYDL